MRKALPPDAVGLRPPRSPEHVAWPCRYCQQRGTVLVTLRQQTTLVCFCNACEQGWTTDERGRPLD